MPAGYLSSSARARRRRPSAPPASEPVVSAQACVANIGPRQRRQRLVFGVIALAAGAVILAGLLAADAPRATRLLGALPFWAAMLGFLQYREKT